MRKRSYTIGTALAIACVGLLVASQAADARHDVSDLEAAQIVGGQSGQCGTTTGPSSTGCNVSTSSWKGWDSWVGEAPAFAGLELRAASQDRGRFTARGQTQGEL